MPAPKKNQFWKLREKDGRNKIFSSDQELWEAACKYFEWSDNHPLKEQKVFGTGMRMTVSHPRPYTIRAMCFHLGIGLQTWNDYKNKTKYKKFSRVIEAIEQVTYSQKFEGASVGFFNANLISRDLGLADKTHIDFSKLDDSELDKILERLLNTQRHE